MYPLHIILLVISQIPVRHFFVVHVLGDTDNDYFPEYGN